MHRLAERLAQAEDNGGSLQKVYWNPQPDWEPGCVLTESDVGKHGYLTVKQKNPVFVVGFPAIFAGKVCPKAVSSSSPEVHTRKDFASFFWFCEKSSLSPYASLSVFPAFTSSIDSFRYTVNDGMDLMRMKNK